MSQNNVGQLQYDWKSRAKERLKLANGPEVNACLERLNASQLKTLGPYVTSRLQAAAQYSHIVLPAAVRGMLGFELAYFIGWVFGLDELMDNCTDLSVLDDLRLILEKQLDEDLGSNLSLETLSLHNDINQPIPGVPFTLKQLVTALIPLRQNLDHKAVDLDGLTLFDDCLMQQVIPSMTLEAQWRLNDNAPADFASYLDNGSLSICAMISVGLVTSILPEARAIWKNGESAIVLLGKITRLLNDIATHFRDNEENRVNAIGLLAQETDIALKKGKQIVQDMIYSYCVQLEQYCDAYMHNDESCDDPTYIHFAYIFYCAIISQVMYSNRDFNLTGTNK